MEKENMSDLYLYEKELKNNISMCEKALTNPVPGKLRISSNNGAPSYYHRKSSKDSRGTYISKANIDFARMLAQKEYDLRILEEMKNELSILELAKYNSCNECFSSVYDSLNSYRKELIDKRFLSTSEFVTEWESEVYATQGFDPDDTSEHYLDNGIRVRSKSERLIGNALLYKHVPFKYEKTIILKNGEWLSPDFTCLNTRTRKEYVWEHLGRMSDESYANKNIKKIDKYIANGYTLGHNLLLTFESRDVPVSALSINHTIQQYLL